MSRSPKGARTDPNSDVDHLAEAMADVIRLPPDPPRAGSRRSGARHAARATAPLRRQQLRTMGQARGVTRRVSIGVSSGSRRLRPAAGSTCTLSAADARNVKQFIDNRRHRDR
jgi:hypothetical protein